jgi:flagellar hook-basal body complex protein FliE
MSVELPGVMSIGQIGEIVNQVQKNEASSGASFSEFLHNALTEVNNLQKISDVASTKLTTGEITDLHSVMIAGEKANLALQLTVQVRNKVIEAYQEVMRMQV